MASYCATKDLSDRDISNLAAFLGHDVKVHFNTYRQNPLVSQVTHLAPILNTAQGRSEQNAIGRGKPKKVVQKRKAVAKRSNYTKIGRGEPARAVSKKKTMAKRLPKRRQPNSEPVKKRNAPKRKSNASSKIIKKRKTE